MVRGKVELRRIDDRAKRLVSFSKRRSGLLKKARELAVLCDAEVGVIVFSPKGKLSHYSSQSSMEKTIQRYENFLDAERSVRNLVLQVEGRCVEAADQVTNHTELELDQTIPGDGRIEQLDVDELAKLEGKLESKLGRVRSRKVLGRDEEGQKEEELRRSDGNPTGSNSGRSTSSNAPAPPPPARTLQLFADA